MRLRSSGVGSNISSALQQNDFSALQNDRQLKRFSDMKRLLLLFSITPLLLAQTNTGGLTPKGSVDASGATATKPSKAGTALPATCSTGETYFKTDATAGLNWYLCTGTNTWTAVGTLACATCVVASSPGAGIAHFAGSTQTVTSIDFPDTKIIPAANCDIGVAGGGWSFSSATFATACRAGSNNLGGSLQAIPSTGAVGQFLLELPLDWDTSSQPYVNLFYGSGANTSGTVIWTVSSACSKADGSVTDDAAFNAESAFGAQTMAVANRMWSKSGQFTAVTSGNNCVPGGTLIIKAAVSGTAGSNINVYQGVVTIPRLVTAQAN